MSDQSHCRNYSQMIRTCKLHISLFRILAFSLFCIVAPVTANSSSILIETDLSKLRGGETLVRIERSEEQNTGRVEATILIDAPAELIWQIMTDCDVAPSFVPGLAACRILESGDNWQIIHHDVKWIWFLPKFSYVFRADYLKNRHIDFKRIRGDLKEMTGSWRLETLEDGKETLVHYSVYLNPGFHIPQWVVRQSLKKNLPEVLIALRAKVENIRKAEK